MARFSRKPDRPLGADNDETVYPAEPDFNFFLSVAQKNLEAGCSIEETVIAIREATRTTFSDERLQNSVAWVFRKRYDELPFLLMHDELGAAYVVDAYLKDYDGEKALKQLHVESPKEKITNKNVLAVMMIFAAFQYLRFHPSINRKFRLVQGVLIGILFTVGFAFIAGGIILLLSLASSGIFEGLLLVIPMFGCVGLWQTSKQVRAYRRTFRRFQS